MGVSNILVDSHVHYYDCYRQEAFFSGAARNFDGAARALKVSENYRGCLLLSETSQDHYFSAWRAEAERSGDGEGPFQKTEEACSLLFARPGQPPLTIIAGRQIATAERLEVLALGHDGEFADGQDLASTLEAVAQTSALAVIPWGFGKWWFKRGRLLSTALKAGNPANLRLGDNGGRPRGAPASAIFTAARAQGYGILPGTDPLDLPEETGRAGGYGFALETAWDAERPFASLKAALEAEGPDIRSFGSRVGLAKFLISQIRIRL